MRRIMVVDDEPFNIKAIVGMMVTLGMPNRHIVDTCLNGEQAIELMQRAIDEGDPDRYGLILTDLSMPFMDGFEASRIMREIRETGLQRRIDSAATNSLVIIAVTGHSEPEYINKAFDNGIDELMPKPMTAVQLGRILVRYNYLRSIGDVNRLM